MPECTNEARRPDLSVIIPCFNEEDVVRNTAARLWEAFRAFQVDVELVLVDNGSQDRTGAVIDELIREGFPIAKVVVERNEGYGNGVLHGLRHTTADLVAFLCADEQVEAVDVVKLYQIAVKARTPKLFKVRRRFRLDGPVRRVVSTFYNLLANALFGELGTMDINANPKMLHRRYLELMNLESKDWFLDMEVMLKAKRMGLGVYEMNVFSLMRAEGGSNVRPATCWEFLVNLFKLRFSEARGVAAVRPVAICKSGTASGE